MSRAFKRDRTKRDRACSSLRLRQQQQERQPSFGSAGSAGPRSASPHRTLGRGALCRGAKRPLRGARTGRRGRRGLPGTLVAPAMVASPADLVAKLSSSGDRDARLKAVRDIKNVIIGNKQKKQVFVSLGAVPRVVELLSRDAGGPLLVQCAAAVGSFAYGLDAGVQVCAPSPAGILLGVSKFVQALGAACSRALPLASLLRPAAAGAQPRLPSGGRRRLRVSGVLRRTHRARTHPSARRAQAVLASGGVAHLLAALGSEDEAVVLAASRALKMVYQVRTRRRRARAAPAARRALTPCLRGRSRPWRRRRTRWRGTRWRAWCGCWARPTRASPRSPRACSRAAATPPSRCRLFLAPTALTGLSVCTRGAIRGTPLGRRRRCGEPGRAAAPAEARGAMRAGQQLKERRPRRAGRPGAHLRAASGGAGCGRPGRPAGATRGGGARAPRGRR